MNDVPPNAQTNESPPTGANVRGACGPVVIESSALLQGASEVVIRHEGREYRLRRTRLGKLILTA